jgi:F-type H+-transporting ATPase subunit epsilon
MPATQAMRLRIVLPTQVLVDTSVRKVVAEAENGSFALLPRHIDMVTALVPGILAYVDDDGRQHLVGIDEGILVKCGHEVQIASGRAIRGSSLKTLKREIERWFHEVDEQAASARTAMARLEAGVIRRFTELRQRTP